MNIYNKYEFSNYIVYELEFYEMTLKKYLLLHGPLSRKLKFFTDFISNIADALKIMNPKGIIHRNIKPRNIYFDNNFNAKLGGFGCSIFSKENNNESVGNLRIIHMMKNVIYGLLELFYMKHYLAIFLMVKIQIQNYL